MNTELTVDYLQQAFEHYNNLIFEGKLPLPKLRWSHAKTRLGQMACKRKMSWGRTKFYDYTISISSYYKLMTEQIDDILIHEMIHYSIAYTGLKDTSSHGVVFRGMMDKINRTFGRHITISVRTRNLKPQAQQPPRSYLILAIVTKDGEYFLSSVNPTAAGKLSQTIARSHDITHHAWYQTQDEYFRSFPRVRSLRGKQVSVETYTMITNKMKLLK